MASTLPQWPPTNWQKKVKRSKNKTYSSEASTKNVTKKESTLAMASTLYRTSDGLQPRAMASNLLAMASNRWPPPYTSDGLQPMASTLYTGLQPTSEGLQPTSDGPRMCGHHPIRPQECSGKICCHPILPPYPTTHFCSTYSLPPCSATLFSSTYSLPPCSATLSSHTFSSTYSLPPCSATLSNHTFCSTYSLPPCSATQPSHPQLHHKS